MFSFHRLDVLPTGHRWLLLRQLRLEVLIRGSAGALLHHDLRGLRWLRFHFFMSFKREEHAKTRWISWYVWYNCDIVWFYFVLGMFIFKIQNSWIFCSSEKPNWVIVELWGSWLMRNLPTAHQGNDQVKPSEFQHLWNKSGLLFPFRPAPLKHTDVSQTEPVTFSTETQWQSSKICQLYQDWLLFMSHDQPWSASINIKCININYILYYIIYSRRRRIVHRWFMSRVDSHESRQADADHHRPMASPRLFVEKAMIRIQVKSLAMKPHGTQQWIHGENSAVTMDSLYNS